MKNCKVMLKFLLFFCGCSLAYAQPDPRDSIILESKTVSPGVGSPATSVRVWITNKDTLGAVSLLLQEKSLSGDAYMTLSWPRSFSGVVTTLTTTLTNYQTFFGGKYNSSSPDSFSLAGLFDPQNKLATIEPPNTSRKAFWEIKFDSVRSNAGQIELDTARIFENYSSFAGYKGTNVKVNFVKGIITVPDITPPSVTVTIPNGGEYASKTCPPFTIEWNATDNVGITGVEIRLDRTNNGDFEEQIANLSGNPGSYDWTPTGQNSTSAKIKVIATDAAGNVGSDVSNGTFTIGNNCYQKPAVGFDANKDGVLSLIDAVLLLSAVHAETNDGTTNKEYIKSLLNAIFSGSP